MPMSAQYFAQMGIGRDALANYRRHLKQLADHYGAAVEDFESQEENLLFSVDHRDHPSRVGWLFLNEAMDRFFHDQNQPASGATLHGFSVPPNMTQPTGGSSLQAP
jgi:hypothetical protein